MKTKQPTGIVRGAWNIDYGVVECEVVGYKIVGCEVVGYKIVARRAMGIIS